MIYFNFDDLQKHLVSLGLFKDTPFIVSGADGAMSGYCLSYFTGAVNFGSGDSIPIGVTFGETENDDCTFGLSWTTMQNEFKKDFELAGKTATSDEVDYMWESKWADAVSNAFFQWVVQTLKGV